MQKLINQFPKALKISVLVFVLLQILDAILGSPVVFNYKMLVSFLFTMMYSMSLYFTNAMIFLYLDNFFEDRFSKKRLIIGFLSSFIVSLIVIFFLHLFEEVVYDKQTFEYFIENEKPSNYLMPIIITFFVTLSIYAISFYKSYQENKVKEQKIIAGTASAKFESLKNQIDPHFLFNSLNVLNSLIEENPENAQKFTTSLSKIYRYVLEQKDKDLVTVDEELTFAKTYINLLMMRFENGLSCELPEFNLNPEAKVVPLSLQLLLENTIKHNIISEQKPLHIKIYTEKNYLVVENNFQKKEVLDPRQGVGLQNIVNRYALISERKVLIESNQDIFKVKIPILTKQISIMETQNIQNENMAYNRAKERVEKLKGFYGNLISYCCVIPTLVVINLVTFKNFQWFWFPMLGWGMGLTFHALETFGFGKSWEERKLNEILNSDKKNKWQ